MDDIVNINYLMKKTGLSRSGTYNLVKTDAIPVMRFGHSLRFKKSDVDKYIESCQMNK